MRRNPDANPTAATVVARWAGSLACAAALAIAAPAGAQQNQPTQPGAPPGSGQTQQQPTQTQQQPTQAPTRGSATQAPQGAQAGAASTAPDAGRQGAAQQGARQQGGAQAAGETPPDITVVMIEEAAQQPPVEISAGELAANPSQYYGRNVRVSAEVEEVFGPRSFTLDEDRAFAGPDVLVLAPSEHATPSDGSHVTVTGVVRPYVRTQLDRDYSWFDMEDEYEVTLRTRPVVIANTVAPETAER